jgi:deoxyribodipyrimidine photo-lyase
VPIIHWFRRDLRLRDNTALQAAVRESGGAVIPVFILDERLLHGRWSGAARLHFLLQSLQALDAALRERGSRLVLRRGTPHAVLLELLHESGATAVYWNHDYSPYAQRRDATVAQALHEAGFTTHSFKDLVLCEPDEVSTTSGTPYKVYTPYAKQWRQHLEDARAEMERRSATATPPQLAPLPATLPTLPLPTLDELGPHTTRTMLPGGEQHGQQLLHAFTDPQHHHTIATYHTERDMLALPATSRLSPHLRMGTVSVRDCLLAALHNAAGAGAETWIGELAWRDFYIQILAHFPHVLTGAFKPEYDALEWENDTALFDAWRTGQTGYPVVDAAMRQLQREAWMHNRARMIVASFLTKDLLIDWRWGEQYFMQQLVDGDPAANNGGWQWAAGTGTDAQPYFRIFNPVSQGKKFDPHGAYVRRYLPELADVPDRYIHEPWRMPASLQQQCSVRIGHTYPAPIVDHKEQRARALEMYRKR